MQKNHFLEKYVKYKDWVFVFLFGIALFIIVYFTCTPREFTDDDWGIANYFAGVIDEAYATPYNKFINFILGWVMYLLYQAIPGPNWFVIAQEAIIIVSFAILQYILIQKLKEHISTLWSYIFSSALLLAFEPSYLSLLQFTQTAAVGSIMGFSLAVYSFRRCLWKGYVCGIILCLTSALYRFSAFEMSLPFAGLMLMVFVIDNAGKFSLSNILGVMKREKGIYITLLSIFLFGYAVSKINTAIYNSDYYAEYNAFNSARASVLDYPLEDYENLEDELTALGVSENDYSLIKAWAVADPSFITTDLLKEIAAVEPKQNDDRDYRGELKDYFKGWLDHEDHYNRLFYMALIVILVCLLIDTKRMRFIAPILLFVTIAVEIYLSIIVMRYPSYVKTGLLFPLIATTVLLTDYKKIKQLKGRKQLILVSIAVFLCMGFLGNSYYLEEMGEFEYDMEGLAMYEYMNSREDDIFMIFTKGSGGLPLLRESYSIFQETKPGIMKHTVSLGGWSTNNPWMREAYSSWGIDYPMSQAADENVYLIGSAERIRNIQTYLKEHRNMDTAAALSAIEYGTRIYKVTDSNINVKKSNFSDVVSAELKVDEDYGTFDISVGFNCNQNFDDGGRLFITLESPDGRVGYFHAFNGNDIKLSQGENSVSVKVPIDILDADQTYNVNLMYQYRGENLLNSGKGGTVVIPFVEIEIE